MTMYDSKIAPVDYGNHRCKYLGKAGDASRYFIAHRFCLLAADDIPIGRCRCMVSIAICHDFSETLRSRNTSFIAIYREIT